MEQRDLIKEQIEQIGKILGKIIANFLGLNSSEQILIATKATHAQLKSELDIDTSKILKLNKHQLKDYLISKNLTAKHIEILSVYFEKTGLNLIKENKSKADSYLRTTLNLIDITNIISKSISFTNINRKLKIENLVEGKL